MNSPPEKEHGVDSGEAEIFFQRGNALLELKRFAEAVSEFDQAIAKNPGFASAHNNRGNAIKKLGRIDEAIVGYGRAIALKPDFANAYYNRANTLRDLGRLEEAVEDYLKALSINPDSFRVLGNLATVQQALGRYQESIDAYDRAIALNPGDSMLHRNRGNALVALGDWPEAEASFNRATALKPDSAEAYFCKSLLKLAQGDFENGWALYEWRFAVPGLFESRGFAQPQWRGDFAISGRTILLHAEQGLGDTLQFCRYVPQVVDMGATVLLELPRSLIPLMRSLGAGIEFIVSGNPLPPFDCHCPLLSLPLAFTTRLETIPSKIPYLSAMPVRISDWHESLGERTRPRIGIVWSGLAQYAQDWNRSIPLSLFEPLLSLDAEFHALQKDIREEDLQFLTSLGRPIVHSQALIDFNETAALTEQMDLVISVDTSLAHLAGALGKTLWVLLARNADFRWLSKRSDSPWYPNAHLFRQSRLGNWTSVLSEIESRLKERFQSLQ